MKESEVKIIIEILRNETTLNDIEILKFFNILKDRVKIIYRASYSKSNGLKP